MKLLACVVAVLLSSTQMPPKPGTVTTVNDPKADFTKFATYGWERGQETFDPVAHKTIVAAIDAEMAARGLRKVDKGGDVNIRYYALVRTDVDLDTIDELKKQGKLAEAKSLGRLAVVMRNPANQRLWAADTVQALDAERAKAYTEIAPIVGKLFDTYPVKKK